MATATTERKITALREIRADMQRDVVDFDGSPLNGKTVAVAVGRLSAAIYALAGIMLSDLEDEST
jgi:hypothetical protein